VSITDPLGCTGTGDLLDVQVVVNNAGGALVGATVQSSLPVGLNGLPGSCTFVGGSGIPTCTVTLADMTWTGDLPANSVLTISYQVRVAPGVDSGDPLCIDTLFDNGAGGTLSINECTTVDCPPTAAELRFFQAIGLADRAVVTWETAGEAGMLGFNLYRATSLAGPWQPVNVALVPGRGASASGADYVLRDAPGPGTFLYRLEEVDSRGKRTLLATTGVRVGPDATGWQVYAPSVAAWRDEQPARNRTDSAMAPAQAQPVVPPAPSGETRLARWWRWLTE